MAVGIIIGAAFGTIVKSLVADVIMPPIGMLMGKECPHCFTKIAIKATRCPHCTSELQAA